MCQIMAACQNNNYTIQKPQVIPKIENVRSTGKGSFPNGIDIEGTGQLVIQNMNPFHVQTTYGFIDRGTEHYNKVVDYINSVEWRVQEESYQSVCSLKGKYMIIVPNEDGTMRYGLMMNEIIIPSLDGKQYGNLIVDNSDVDTSVQVYLIHQNGDQTSIYQTNNKQLYNCIQSIGDSYQETRVPSNISVWTSQQNLYENIAFKVDLPQEKLNQYSEEESLGIELQNFIISAFKNDIVTLQTQEDPYIQVEESDYDYGIQISDQNKFGICTLYIMKDGSVKMYDYLGGKKWTSTVEQFRVSLIDYIDKIQS